jgi:hypothetical protein
MREDKPWYLSKTIWSGLVTMAAAFAGLAGAPVAGLDHAALTETILQAVSALSGLFAIFGRLSATARIG